MSIKINEILDRFESKRTNLLPILQEVNSSIGHISEENMKVIADFMNISPAEVYGETTFYSFLNIKPKGKYIIRLCKSITCELKNKDEIASILEEELGIKFGETTKNNLVTLEYTNCMGMCDVGPAMLVNDKIYTKLNPEELKKIITELKR